MAINPKIKQKAEDIRKKIFGSEVRESLASGIEAISEDVEVTIGRQDYVEEQFQDVLVETTGKDVISAPELIAARNGEANLKTRLDKEKQEVTTQLQQTEQELSLQLAEVVRKTTPFTINIEIDWGIQSDVDESVKFQEKINNLPDDVILVFPNKRYILNNISINHTKNLKFVANNTTIESQSGSFNIFNFSNCENVEITGFKAIGSWEIWHGDFKGHFCNFENCNNILINQNNLIRCGVSGSELQNVTITKNKFYDPNKINHYPIILMNSANNFITLNNINNYLIDGIKIAIPEDSSNKISDRTIISNNIIQNCGKDGIDLFSGGKNTIISGNHVTNCEKGITVKAFGYPLTTFPFSKGYANNVIVSDNILIYNIQQCIWLGSSNVLVNNNLLLNSGVGVYIKGEDELNPIKNIKISNCIIKNMGINGIFTFANSGVDDVTIDSCQIENVTSFGISVYNNGLTVSNTILKDVGSRGLFYNPIDESKLNICNLNGVQVLNINKTNTEFGIRLSSNTNPNSLVTSSYTFGVASPFFSDGVVVKDFANSWTI